MPGAPAPNEMVRAIKAQPEVTGDDLGARAQINGHVLAEIERNLGDYAGLVNQQA